ncbi:hypothetical protein SteCoe_5916 [Stentor coeruleus]|uniref:Uncharacterized protein n=1 Tax=Stentor coeruleus TaxID=5963 RepID=A0A1R2CRA6_9CILI|nr:hypothetical protein SteCoe_5916 [Stentor coeruleus]
MQVDILRAIFSKDLDLVRKLFENKSPNIPLTTYSQTALHFAVIKNNKDLALLLINELNAETNPYDINGWTPLGLIGIEGNDDKYEIAQFLISAGADVDFSNRNSNYCSPFDFAKDNRDNCPEIFKLFSKFTKRASWKKKKALIFLWELERLRLV